MASSGNTNAQALATSSSLQDRPDNGGPVPPQIGHNDHESRNNSSSAAPAGDEQDTRLRSTNGLFATLVGAPPEREQDTPGTVHQPSSPEPSQAGSASETEQRTETGDVTSSTRTETGTFFGSPHQLSTKERRSPSFFRRLAMRIRRCFGRRHLNP